MKINQDNVVGIFKDALVRLRNQKEKIEVWTNNPEVSKLLIKDGFTHNGFGKHIKIITK